MKEYVKIMLVAFLVVGLAFQCSVAAAKEYKVVALRMMNVSENKQTEILNREAKEGWRLVAVTELNANIFVYLEKDGESE